MKKVLCILLVAVLALSTLAACGGEKATTYEIAVVTDVGQLMDGGFNQGTYEGAKTYAEANNKTFQYYQPANGADATDNDRIAAMNSAIQNGAKVIVAPGFLQATAMTTVAEANPDVKFVFVDGWSLSDSKGAILKNVTAIVYKEQESGYMAGYAVVKDGYTKLGGTFGGGGTNPACNRFGYGFAQGAVAAAKELGVNIELRYSFKYGDTFSASTELQTQMASWYAAGTEIVFSCGGSMVSSVLAAASETTNGKVVGVDTDQSVLSDRVITSAVKGLAVSVNQVLTQNYNGEWDAKLAGQTQNLGAAEDATGIPTASWRFSKFTVAEYNDLFAKIKAGTVAISADNTSNCTDGAIYKALASDTVTVIFE